VRFRWLQVGRDTCGKGSRRYSSSRACVDHIATLDLPSCCSNGFFADQHTVLLGDTLRPFLWFVLCVTIRVSGNLILGATLHVVFYFTLLLPVPWRVTATRS
jgi:hypothetical protein